MSTEWDEMLEATKVAPADFRVGNLAHRFLIPPFTVLNTTSGGWPERRRAWLGLGIKSEVGRGDLLTFSDPNLKDMDVYRNDAYRSQSVAVAVADMGSMARNLGRSRTPRPEDEQGAGMASGTSIFDPVLCELVYRWWAPEGGAVLDPFAGGSVRGIVASVLGHPYTGIDLSAPQVAANRQQAQELLTGVFPRWMVGDSNEALDDLPAGEMFDLVFTCPPYYDLEVYSREPGDISAMGTLAEFAEAYTSILAKAVHRLRDNRFAVVVIGEARYQGGRRKGHLYGLVPITIAAMEMAGAAFYNDGILVNSAGTLTLRTGGQFTARTSGRKLGRQHQYVLVFIKGDPPTGEWSYDRERPPDPQQVLGLAPDDPAPLDEPAPVSVHPQVPAPPDAPVPDIPVAGSGPAVAPLLATAGPQPTPVPTYEEGRQAADSFAMLVRDRLGILMGSGVRLRAATAMEDKAQATDYVATSADGTTTVAVRVRGVHPGVLSPPVGVPRDMTIRTHPDEAEKLRAGYADRYFYAWADGTDHLVEWVFIDMDRWRAMNLWSHAGAERPSPDGTRWRAIPLAVLGASLLASSHPIAELTTSHQRSRAFVRCPDCGGTLLVVAGVRSCEECGRTL